MIVSSLIPHPCHLWPVFCGFSTAAPPRGRSRHWWRKRVSAVNPDQKMHRWLRVWCKEL
jgi:hypothetical protein